MWISTEDLWSLVIGLMILFGIIIILVILIFVGVYLTITSVLNTSFEQWCSKTNFYQYTPFPTMLTMNYDPILSSFLLLLDLNASLTKCPKKGNLPLPPNFDQVFPLNGSNTTVGYVLHSTSMGITIFSFGGTELIPEYLSDANWSQVFPKNINNTSPGMLVHQGIYNIYISIRSQLISIWQMLQSNTKILIISGHSLGGALSNIAGLDFATLQPIVYTFAAPRVFNNSASNTLDKTLINFQRIFNTEDIIPDLPLPLSPTLTAVFEYQQSGNNIPFTLNLDDFSLNHTQAYVDVIVLGRK